MMPESSRYTSLQITLHWIVVVLIACQFLFSDGMEHAWRGLERGQGIAPDALLPARFHAVAGVLILICAILRIALRFTHGKPPLPASEPQALRWLAHISHFLLYLLIILLPLSGMAAWFGGVAPAAGAHVTMKTILLFVIGLHVLGALYQFFVGDRAVALRMVRPER